MGHAITAVVAIVLEIVLTRVLEVVVAIRVDLIVRLLVEIVPGHVLTVVLVPPSARRKKTKKYSPANGRRITWIVD